jgi:hypothetical protein
MSFFLSICVTEWPIQYCCGESTLSFCPSVSLNGQYSTVVVSQLFFSVHLCHWMAETVLLWWVSSFFLSICVTEWPIQYCCGESTLSLHNLKIHKETPLWILSWANSIQSIMLTPFTINFILLLGICCHLNFVLPKRHRLLRFIYRI